jgi:hypothetical protein
MSNDESDPARLLAAAGLPLDIESPRVVASQFAVSRALLALIWSVPADADPALVFTARVAVP